MSQRLLVFGGGGFVGGNLSALALRDGWEVHVADAAVRDALPGARAPDRHHRRARGGARPSSLVPAQR